MWFPGESYTKSLRVQFLKKGGLPEVRREFPPSQQSVHPLRTFQDGGIHVLSDLLRKGDFVVRIDLKDAYFTVPVWKNYQSI